MPARPMKIKTTDERQDSADSRRPSAEQATGMRFLLRNLFHTTIVRVAQARPDLTQFVG
jgi:hypothetical protein